MGVDREGTGLVRSDAGVQTGLVGSERNDAGVWTEDVGVQIEDAELVRQGFLVAFS